MTATIPSASPKAFRRAADLLMRDLGRKGVELSHPAALDALSAAHGVADWNTMSALLKAAAQHPAPVPAGAGGPVAAQAAEAVFPGRVAGREWGSFQAWICQRTTPLGLIALRAGRPAMAEDGRPMTEHVFSAEDIADILGETFGDDGRARLRLGDVLEYTSEYAVRRGSPEQTRCRAQMTAFRANNGIHLEMRPLGIAPVLPDGPWRRRALDWLATRQGGMVLVCGPDGAREALIAGLVRARCEVPDAGERVVDFARPFPQVYDGLDLPSSYVMQMEVGDGMSMADRIETAIRRRGTIVVPGSSQEHLDPGACAAAISRGVRIVASIRSSDLVDGLMGFCSRFPSRPELVPHMALSAEVRSDGSVHAGGCTVLGENQRVRLNRAGNPALRSEKRAAEVVQEAVAEGMA